MTASVRRLLRLCTPERPALVRGFGAHILASLLQVVPAVMAVVVVIALADGQSLDADDAAWIAAVCVGSLLLRYALARHANGILWVVAYRITGRIRRDLLERMRSAPPAVTSGDNAGRALTVLTYDAGKIAGFLSWEMPVFLSGAVVPVVVLVVYAVIAPWMAVVAAAVALVAIPVLRFGIGRVMDVYAERRRLQAEATDRMLEYVRGIDVIRAHAIAGERQARFAEALDGIRDADVASVDRLTPAYSAFQSLIDAGVAAIVLAAGLLLTTDGTVGDTTSSLIAALLLTTVLFRPQLDVGARALHLPELAASLERVEEWMAIPTVPERPVAAIELLDGGADVRLTGVTAGYQPGVDVIRGLDLEARAGTVTALVGPSGAGKTTVLRLVAGLLSPRAGTVSIGGVDIEQMPATQSAGLVTAVFQDVGVLSGTVATAISSGDPMVTRERIEDVARAAHIHDRIMELPHGYDSVIGEEGRTLSGGERQRLGIARALCKDAPVVLLDEATSALDPTNERLLREALANLVRGRTLLVVAHRLETIRNADRIVFVDGGAVVESGTHDELLELGGRYASFWEIRRRAAGWSLARS